MIRTNGSILCRENASVRTDDCADKWFGWVRPRSDLVLMVHASPRIRTAKDVLPDAVCQTAFAELEKLAIPRIGTVTARGQKQQNQPPALTDVLAAVIIQPAIDHIVDAAIHPIMVTAIFRELEVRPMNDLCCSVSHRHPSLHVPKQNGDFRLRRQQKVSTGMVDIDI